MKILITGGSGFIGSNLIKYLINFNKYTICNIDALTRTSVPHALKKIKYDKYFFKKIDICNYNKLKKTILDFQPNIIMHLAAESHVDTSIVAPRKFIDTNIIGTFNLLDICNRFLIKRNNNKFKFLHISTDEVFGSLDKGSNSFTEKSNYLPNSPYSSSKASSNHLVRAWVKTYNFPGIITNCSNNYGPWQHPEKLIPHTIARCILKSPIPIYGIGKNQRDWIFVLDHVRALFKLMHKGKVGETYNIGTNKTLTNIDLVNKICKLIDKKNIDKNNFYHNSLITFVQDRKGHDFKYSINSSKLCNSLNFKFEYDLKKGLDYTVNWYLDNSRWLIKSFNSKFNR